MAEIRVTVNGKLDSFLDEVVASGLYPSKAEFARCSIVHLLKYLGLLQNLINTNKKTSNI